MQLDPTTTTQLLSIATGLVATVGGLAISYLTLRHEFNKTKKRVRVSMKKGLLIGVPNTNPKKTYLTVTISNVGNVSYTLATLYVAFGRYSDGVIIPNPLGTVKLPYVLASDHSCTFWTEYENIAKHVAKSTWRKHIKIRAHISDYTDTLAHSNWLEVEIKATLLSKLKSGALKAFRWTRKQIIP